MACSHIWAVISWCFTNSGNDHSGYVWVSSDFFLIRFPVGGVGARINKEMDFYMQ